MPTQEPEYFTEFLKSFEQFRIEIKDEFKFVHSKMDNGFRDVYEKMDNGFKDVYSKMNNGFKVMDEKMDNGFKAMDEKIDNGFRSADQRFESHTDQIVEISEKLTAIEIGQGKMQTDINIIKGDIVIIKEELKGKADKKDLIDLTRRVIVLERKSA